MASFNSMLSLVWSYISTANRCSSNTDTSLTSFGVHMSSLKVPFTSERHFKFSQAVFVPLPENAESVTTSERVKHQKSQTVCLIHCGKHFLNSYVMYQKLHLTPKGIPELIRSCLAQFSHSQYQHVTCQQYLRSPFYKPFTQHMPLQK